MWNHKDFNIQTKSHPHKHSDPPHSTTSPASVQIISVCLCSIDNGKLLNTLIVLVDPSMRYHRMTSVGRRWEGVSVCSQELPILTKVIELDT